MSHDLTASLVDAPSPGPAVALDPSVPGVELVRWPADALRRSHLADDGRPRLLVIEPDAPPPLCWDDLEDWVRSPADPREVAARSASLLRRASAEPALPVLDADGVLRRGADLVTVPPVEARLLARLLHRPGTVVDRDALLDAGWPTGAGDPRILDGRIKLLRRRVERLGLAIRTVRGVGFLLEGSAPAPN